MEVKDSLFELINALTKNEKINFKKFISQNASGKDSGYVLLYDILDKQKEFNRTDAVNSLLKKDCKDNYSEIRNYLYNKILDFLANFHSTDSIQRYVDNEILKAQVLFEKNLSADSKKILSQAKEIAKKNELHLQILKIIRLEQMLVNKLKVDNISNVYHEFSNEQKVEIEKLTNSITYTNLINQLFSFYINENQIRDVSLLQEIEKIMKHELLTDYAKAITHNSKINFYYAKIYYYNLKSDKENLFDAYEKYIELLESENYLKKENTYHYYVILGNYIMLSIALRKFENIGEKIKIIENVKLSRQFQQDRIYNLLMLIKAKILTLQGNTELLKVLLNKWEKESKDIFETPYHKELLLNYKLANAYFNFLVEDYKLANKHIMDILNDDKDEVRKDIVLFARIFKLIIDFELKKYDLLDFSINATKALLKRHQQLFEFESMLLKHLKELVFVNDKVEQIEKFKLLKTEILKDEFKLNLDLLNEQFNILAWIDGKIENKNLLTIIKENALNEFPQIMSIKI